MPEICLCENTYIATKTVISDVGNFRSKSGFVFSDGIAVPFLPSLYAAENMINNCSDSSSNKPKSESEPNFFGLTHNDLIVGLLLLFGFVFGSLYAHLLVWVAQRIKSFYGAEPT